MISKKTDRRAELGLAVLALVWGYNWVVMKIALAYASPLDFAALRAGCGSAALLLILLILGKPVCPPKLPLTVLLGLLQTTGFVGLISLALHSGKAGKSAVLVFTMPFWVILLAHLFLGEKLRPLQWTASLLGFTGLLLALEPWTAPPDLASGLLAVLAGLTWAAAVIVAKKIPLSNRWELLSLTTWQMVIGSLPLIALALVLPSPPIEWTPPFLAALAFNTLPANALGWLLWIYILQKLPANVTGLSTLAIPVIGMTAAWLQLAERPRAFETAGLVLILCAIAVLTHSMLDTGPPTRTPPEA